MEGFEGNLEFADIMRIMDISMYDLELVFKSLDGDNSGDVLFGMFW